jgi:hypothetical protein
VNTDRWLEVAGLLVAVLGVLFGYFSLTNETFRGWFFKRSIRNIPPAFAKLAGDYRDAHKIPDNSTEPKARVPWEDRTRKKDVLAEGLGRFAQGARIDRKVLAELQNDGYVVALAKLIAVEPRQGDVSLIAKAVKFPVPPHADIATLAAINVLATNRLINDLERNQTLEAVNVIANRLGEEGKGIVKQARDAIVARQSKPRISSA